jgi:glutamate synthase domain-containing protein 3
MTGGRVLVLGPTGRNFAAGMSGGIAYVLDDENGWFRQFGCNRESVDLEPLCTADVEDMARHLEAHLEMTGSDVARRLLEKRNTLGAAFVKVMPIEYKRALARMSAEPDKR